MHPHPLKTWSTKPLRIWIVRPYSCALGPMTSDTPALAYTVNLQTLTGPSKYKPCLTSCPAGACLLDVKQQNPQKAKQAPASEQIKKHFRRFVPSPACLKSLKQLAWTHIHLMYMIMRF